ncbi:hypothetical protein BS78_03G179800 [Paspalum vaginatum]|nr:hypothetical protein BS78_03G179800 [Paspalum vaginatum]
MRFCGDPCKMEASDEETYRRRSSMCTYWAFDPPKKAVLRGVLIKRRIALRKKEEAAREEKLAEECRRADAARKAEREVKLARAKRAKAALEENPDALSKGKWPCCTQ